MSHIEDEIARRVANFKQYIIRTSEYEFSEELEDIIMGALAESKLNEITLDVPSFEENILKKVDHFENLVKTNSSEYDLPSIFVTILSNALKHSALTENYTNNPKLKLDEDELDGRGDKDQSNESSIPLLDGLGTIFCVSKIVEKIWTQSHQIGQPIPLMILDGGIVNLKPTEAEILERVQDIADTKPGNSVSFSCQKQIAEIMWFTSREEDEYEVIIYGLTPAIIDLINSKLEVD